MSDIRVENPGCVIFLIEESAAMAASVQEDFDQAGAPPKSKGASVATALNSLLKQLAAGPDFDVALVGYQADAAGTANVGSRWSGPLAGREFVPLKELLDSPVTVESRIRRIPNPSGFGVPHEETVNFPIWYVPATGVKAPQLAAFEFCEALLAGWLPAAGANPGSPLIVHLFAGGSTDGNPLKVIERIQHQDLPAGSPLVFHAHLTTAKILPPTLYPSNRAYLPLGPIRDLFERSSLLPAPLVSTLKGTGATINREARGMLYNARMVDIVPFLSVVKAHTRDWPARSSEQAEPESPRFAVPANPLPESAAPVELSELAELPEVAQPDDSTAAVEQLALLVLLLDRSVADPFSSDGQNVCQRLQEDANELLTKIGKKGTGQIDVAIVSYGGDSSGEVEVRTTLEGPLAGQQFVRDSELSSAALRTDEYEEKVPNGVGGMITVPIKKQVFLELESAQAASPVPAFEAIRDLIAEWCGRHPSTSSPPIVLHFTRGEAKPDSIATAAAELKQIQPTAGSVILYHAIGTETPHRSLAYPGTAADIGDSGLKEYWNCTSLLLGRAQLALDKPALINENSRGIVINAKFDLLLNGIFP